MDLFISRDSSVVCNYDLSMAISAFSALKLHFGKDMMGTDVFDVILK
jgi:hypothetical protein